MNNLVLLENKVSYDLALVVTNQDDRQTDIKIFSLIQLTLLFFWAYSLFIVVAGLDARIQMWAFQIGSLIRPYVWVVGILVRSLWFGVVG